MSTVNQTLAFVLQLMIFIPFSIVSKPSQGDPVDRSRYMALSFRALASFALWNFGFSPGHRLSFPQVYGPSQ